MVVSTVPMNADSHLLQRLSRKTLLSISIGGAVLSLAGVGYGLNADIIALASVCILTFVAYVSPYRALRYTNNSWLL